MKNIRFEEFDKWIQKQKEKWKEIGLYILDVSYMNAEQRHSYCVTLTNDSEGEAKLILYESNSIYWVDYEAWNGVSDELFVLTVMEYENVLDLENAENNFFKYMSISK